ncbi:DoxX family protein [Candidatus Woesearchaeota archaeon]|nr:DoxX family protein [Candidatus Woesearchaeota archaeon]
MKQKTIKVIYWAVTILFSLFMLFSGVSEVMQTKQAAEIMKHLGYPIYVNTIIGVAKILGAIAILQWKFRTIKEWAYAGFTIDFIGAGASIYFAGDGILKALSVIPFFVVMFSSYLLWKKVEKVKKSE